MIGGAAFLFGLTPLALAADGVSQSAESIHQEPVFRSNRQRIYAALTDARQFDKVVELSGAVKAMGLTSKPSEIGRQVGGAFSIFGGYITGRQIELVPNERIVEAWRVGSWKPGVFSIAKFELVEQAGSTTIVFDHTGFPSGTGQELADGWKKNYWEPLAKLLTP